ncbi:MAG TPA: hypothetical protein VKA14_10175 [Gammaproteobacteria bacterium]|nr:hypothetical protein [Gammaproteobacteria bacterium]
MDEAGHLGGLLPLIIATVPLTFICYFVARDKGRRAGPWMVLSLIPVVNYFVLLYLVGSVHRDAEGRLRRVRAIIDQAPR